MIRREIDGLELVAVADRDAEVVDTVANELGVEAVHPAEELIGRDDLDAVVIATPHSRHIVYAQAALERGLHVMIEKPVAVSVEGAIRANQAFEQGRQLRPGLVYAAMFQQRLMPVWRRLRDIVREELGRVQRVGWVVTDWFRSDAYYATAGWRATWRHEGGGVLMNQAPHNLDLLLWITGVRPGRVSAVTRHGAHHDIETEDEVAAVIECEPEEGGRTGPLVTFTTPTGEAPGVNRLEIVGDRGTAVAEDGSIRVRRLEQPASEVRRTGPAKLRNVDYAERVETPGDPGSSTYADQVPFRRGIFENFARAVRGGEAVVAPGVEGLAAVELANAMLLAGDRGEAVTLPVDVEGYQEWLTRKISEGR